MDKLWAPWRINYISIARKIRGCLFCRVAKERRDRKNLVVFRSKYVLCLLNKFPYNNGHLMLSPYRHIKNLTQLSNDEILDLFHTLNKMQALLGEILKPDGFNLGMNIGRVAGAGILGHLHLHIVPRWKGDTNFMPAVSNAKIISQSLSELYEKLSQKI